MVSSRFAVISAVCLVLGPWSTCNVVRAQTAQPEWVGAWATAPVRGSSQQALRGETLRQIVHVSIGGAAVRIHISNVFGAGPLSIGDVNIAHWDHGSSIAGGTDRPILFGGHRSVIIAPGDELVSDPVSFSVAALEDVVVSFYIINGDGPPTWHPSGFQTNFIADGDAAEASSLSVAAPTNSYFYLTNLDVETTKPAGAVVAFGASITDGYASTANTNLRWPDDLARRLKDAGREIGVLNEGISGNRLLVNGAGESAVNRFERDVAAQPGVRWVIFSDDPINDLGSTKPQPSADELIDGLKQLIAMAHSHGIKFLCSTLTPYEGAGYWTPAGEVAREQINSYLRSPSSGCDAIVDQARATSDPTHPSRYLPAYDSGDHLHPNDAGLKAIADSVPIDSLVP